jgi:hypothetical protein
VIPDAVNDTLPCDGIDTPPDGDTKRESATAVALDTPQASATAAITSDRILQDMLVLLLLRIEAAEAPAGARRRAWRLCADARTRR